MTAACQHATTRRGDDIPRRYGSFRSEVCTDCGAFRARDYHDMGIDDHRGRWRPAEEYVDATSECEEI